VAEAFHDYLGTYFPIFFVERHTVYLDIAAGTLVGLVAALFPTWRAVNIRIADGLRRIG
jgi:putative ABC transport system permease protein